MSNVEKTIHQVIQSGFSTGMDDDPYRACVYTSFQERATKIAHLNTMKLAKTHGVDRLATICSKIAQDEACHEAVYSDIILQCSLIDPDGIVSAIRYMMDKGIQMPAKNMKGFQEYSFITEKLGVYGINEYIDIYNYLIEFWCIKDLVCTSEKGKKDQEYLLTTLPKKLARFQQLRMKMMENKSLNSLSFNDWFI